MLFVVRILSLGGEGEIVKLRDAVNSSAKTYTNQSIANSRVTSCKGASIAVSTIINRTSAADGTGAEERDAANDVKVTVTISANSSFIPLIWAMKIADTEMNKAVPSMFMTPIGRTNLVILLSILNFCSITWNVEGKAAALNRTEYDKVFHIGRAQ